MAEVVREAVDAYLGDSSNAEDWEAVLDETFGIAPDFEVPPRSEWDHRPRLD